MEHDEADDNPELSAHVPIQLARTGAAGHHRMRGSQSVIGIRDDQAARPVALVATLAHELGHVLLLADGRISAQQEDHEPLTDLLSYSASFPFEAPSSPPPRSTSDNRLQDRCNPMP